MLLGLKQIDAPVIPVKAGVLNNICDTLFVTNIDISLS